MHFSKEKAARIARIPRRRRFLFALMVAAGVLVLPVAVGEAVVRVVFHDGGRRTQGGPGGQEFVYDYIDEAKEFRTPRVPDVKAPGVERVIVLGDSITWGTGIRDWRKIYPNQLLGRLQASGRRFEMEVSARAGKNLDGHVRAAAEWAAGLAPDFLIYQWYVNDIEVDGPAPHEPPWWQQFPLHEWLVSRSWLYYCLERPLAAYASGQAYQRYVLAHFADGSPGWAMAADRFHRWATHSTVHARHVLIFLYPQVPFRGTYPLAEINRRVGDLARSHVLRYPAVVLQPNRRLWDAPPGFVLHSDRQPGILAASPALPFRRGHYEFGARIRLDHQAPGELGALDVVAGEGRILAHRVIQSADVEPSGEWATISVPIDLDAPLTPEVRWLVRVARGVDLSLADLSVPVGYERLDVLDLADRLNAFNTHVSLFDSHPNERAHAEVADALAVWVLSKSAPSTP